MGCRAVWSNRFRQRAKAQRADKRHAIVMPLDLGKFVAQVDQVLADKESELMEI